MLFEVRLTQSGLGKRVELLTEGALSAIFVVGVVRNTTFVTVLKKKKPTWLMCSYSDPTSYENLQKKLNFYKYF